MGNTFCEGVYADTMALEAARRDRSIAETVAALEGARSALAHARWTGLAFHDKITQDIEVAIALLEGQKSA